MNKSVSSARLLVVAKGGEPVARGEGAGRVARRRVRTRQLLLRAAMELLADQGPSLTVQAVTERADVAVGSFYSHFDDKGEIVAQATSQAFAEMREDFLAHADRVRDPVDRFALRVRYFIRSAATRPVAARILVSAFPEPWFSWEMARAGASRVGLTPEVSAVQDLRDAVAAGALRTPRPDHAVLMVAGGSVALMARHLGAPHAEPTHIAREADEFTECALVLLGLDAKAAREVAGAPLPVQLIE